MHKHKQLSSSMFRSFYRRGYEYSYAHLNYCVYDNTYIICAKNSEYPQVGDVRDEIICDLVLITKTKIIPDLDLLSTFQCLLIEFFIGCIF